MSIPNYKGMIDIFTAMALEYMPPNGSCIDIGCSTGNLIKTLAQRTPGLYTGIDKVHFPEWDNVLSEKEVTFTQGDIVDIICGKEGVDLVISLFTLQFLGSHKRGLVITELKNLLSNGATLFLAEKVYSKSAKINSILAREHYRQKRLAFKDTEILDKDYALLGSMFPLTHDEMENELKYLGNAEQVWQSYNFKGWVVTK